MRATRRKRGGGGGGSFPSAWRRWWICGGGGKALFHIFQLSLLLPSADLFQLYLTSPVLVVSFSAVFTALFLRVLYSIGSLGVFRVLSLFADSVVSIPTLAVSLHWYPRSVGNPLSLFGVVLLLLDARMGGVWSVLDPRVE